MTSAGLGTAGLRIEDVTTTAGFDALQSEWDLLARTAPRASIFMTWEWQFLWWKHYGNGRPLHVLVARDGQRLMAILPLYVQTIRLLRTIPLRVLRQVGTGGDTSPDYLEPLCARDGGDAAAEALARHVAGRFCRWNLVVLSDLGSDSPFQRALERCFRERGLWTDKRVSARIRYIGLPSSWDEFLASLSRRRRDNMRYMRRRIDALPHGRFRTWDTGTTDAKELDAVIDRLVELHQMRWENRSARHAFVSDEYRGFHRELMHALQRSGQLRLTGLELEGKAVAILYSYRYRDLWYYFQSGFDPSYGKFSPGLVLLGYSIEQAIAEGCSEFDMLRGEHEYKAQLAKSTRDTYEVRAARPGVRTAIYLLRQWLSGWRARRNDNQMDSSDRTKISHTGPAHETPALGTHPQG